MGQCMGQCVDGLVCRREEWGCYLQENEGEEEDNERNKERKGKEVEFERKRKEMVSGMVELKLTIYLGKRNQALMVWEERNNHSVVSGQNNGGEWSIKDKRKEKNEQEDRTALCALRMA